MNSCNDEDIGGINLETKTLSSAPVRKNPQAIVAREVNTTNYLRTLDHIQIILGGEDQFHRRSECQIASTSSHIIRNR